MLTEFGPGTQGNRFGWASRDLPSVVADVLTDPEGAKNLAGNCPPPDSGPLGDAEFGKKPANLSKQFAESTNR